MASRLSLRPSFFSNPKNVQSKDRVRSWSDTAGPSKIVNIKEQERHGPAKIFISRGCLVTSCTFPHRVVLLKLMRPCVLSSRESAAESDQTCTSDKSYVAKAHSLEMEFNRVNCLVWVLHESARGFSLAIQAHKLARTGPELAMAWVGVDVHAWHKSIAYQVAVYALLKAAIEVELFLSHKRCSNPSHVHEILSEKENILGECIENQLNMKDPKLMQWFRMVELPRIAGLFIPLFKKWSMDYAGSGVAGMILAVSCCAAVRKLSTARICCLSFSASIQDALVELMTLSHNLVSVDKLHQLACEAGFEKDFLSHFGRKILPSENMEDIEFWIGLVQKKLSAAFDRESVTIDKHTFHDKVQENSLATLGLFAYLGRETRLFLSGMGIKDLDEQTKDFLSYLECGSLVIYPEFSTLSEYQLFMEVVTDEIGWLHFYPNVSHEPYQDRKRTKLHTIQAEKEIILYNVLTVCYDIISGFAHYSNSTQQPIDANLLEFLLHSQSLLSMCMEDYWAAYDKTGELQKIMERSTFDQEPSFIVNQMSNELTKKGKDQYESQSNKAMSSAWEDDVALGELGSTATAKPLDENLLRKSSRKLISASSVSAVGHAAILAAIKKYMPCMIPSPYTSERLGLVKQLKRIKKMEFQQRSSIEDASCRVV